MNLLRLAVTVLAVSLPQASTGNELSFSEQLLQSYFDTAGVCTSSSVESIIESSDSLTVNIIIEKTTAKALLDVSNTLKDDWFSLHCPPEIHGVWRQPQPPIDVLVTGALNEFKYHTLSCRSYLNTEHTQALTFSQRIRIALERMLAH